MSLQVVIVLLFMTILVGLMFWYFTQKNELVNIHNQKILNLEYAIFKNRSQLIFRNTNLNRYDFLKYNLNDALVTQQDIRIPETYNYV